MKAIVQDEYGPHGVLRLAEIDEPSIGESQVLLRVRAAAVNPADVFIMTGVPYMLRVTGFGLRRPGLKVRGLDVAGVVAAVGGKVTELRPGDEVFGGCEGAFAEYARAHPDNLAPKPEALSFEQAAAVPMAGVTALQALRDHGKVRPDQRILINGAAGGIGTFAVQIGKHLGAEVTGVCSTGNVEMVRGIGADHVVDYTREDFTRSGRRWDVILDNVGNRSFSDLRRALTRKGTLVPNSGKGGRLIGPLGRLAKALILSPLVSQRFRPFISPMRRTDLIVLKDLIESGAVRPVIDRIHPLAEAAAAMGRVAGGHARGKVVVTVGLAGNQRGRTGV